MKFSRTLSFIAIALGFSTLEISKPANADDLTPSAFELECAPFVHAIGTKLQIKIVSATNQTQSEAQITMGAPSFNIPLITESYPFVQKTSDTHGRTVNYQANNFTLTLDRNTSTADVSFMFNGQEKTARNLRCH